VVRDTGFELCSIGW